MRTRERLLKLFGGVLVVILAVNGVRGEGENSNTTDTTTMASDQGQSPGDQDTAIDKGMKPLYTMTRGFLELIQPNDMFEQLKAKGIITEDKVDFDVLKDTLINDWRFWAEYMVGYLVCVVLGLVLAIIMLIAGPIFCCCRCCGKCGGKNDPLERRNSRCLRYCCGTSLFIINTIIMIGMVMAFMSNELLRQQTDAHPKAALPTIVANLHSVELYKDNTIQSIKTSVFDRLKTEVHFVIDKIKGIPMEAQNEVGKITDVQAIFQAASNLANSVNTIKTSLSNVKSYSDQLKQDGSQLDSDLSTWKQETVSTLSQCSFNNDCVEMQAQINNLARDADFENFQDVSVYLTEVSHIVDSDLGRYISQSREEFEKIQTTVRADATDAIADVESELNKLLDQVNVTVDKFEKQANNFSLNSTRSTIRSYEPLVEEYGTYRWYICIGLSCLLLLIVLFYYLGLAFGACGEPPYEDASTCNRGVGANLLMAGVGFTFLFFWILMLIMLVFFLSGGLSYTEVCRNVVNMEDSKIVTETDQTLKSLMKQAEIDLKFDIFDVLQGCKENEPIYKVLNLHEVINITDVLNLDNWGIKDLINAIGKIDLKLDSLVIMDPELKQQLESLRDANLDQISLSSFNNELAKQVLNKELTSMVQQLQLLIEIFESNPNLQSSIQRSKNELQALQNSLVVPIQNKMQSLQEAVNQLDSEIDEKSGSKTFRNYTQDLLYEYQAAANNIRNNATNIIISFLTRKALEIYEAFNRYIMSVSDKIQNDIGRCHPVYQALDSSIDTVCVDVLNPFNGFWFSMGWCLIFFIPSLFIAVKLVSLYRKTEEYDGPDTKSFDDPNFDAYTGVYPGDNIPLEDYDRKKYYQQGAGRSRGHQNTAYERDNYAPSHMHADAPYRSDLAYNPDTVPGYSTYDRQGYTGGGYGPNATPPNPPHYYNNRNRMY